MNFHEVRFPGRAVGRLERRAGAAHRDRHAEQRLRGAQHALGAFAAALRRRARGALARRPGGGHRVLRGAARAALRLSLEGLDRLQVLRALGGAVGDATRRSGRATAARHGVRAGQDLCARGRRPMCGRSRSRSPGTVRVAVGGVALVERHATSRSITPTGQVTFAAAPAAGAVVTAGFEFDVPVRFDTDRITASLAGFAAGEIPSIPVVEVRV